MALVKPNNLKSKKSNISTSDYVEGRSDLSSLTLEQLAHRYQEIDQQSQLLKGLILLEARNRFKSNNEFGDWVKTVPSLCGDGNQIRNRYMNLAKFFKEKDLTGISLTAAYEISAPVNEKVADAVYKYALNKNLSVADVKKKIDELKNEAGIPLLTNDEQISLLTLAENLESYRSLIFNDIRELPNKEAIKLLKFCLKELQDKEKKDDAIQDAEIIDTSPASEDTEE